MRSDVAARIRIFLNLPEVAVIASIIPSHQMAKCGLAVAPVVAQTQNLGSVHLRDFLTQPVVRQCDWQFLDFLVTLRLVHSHVEDAKVELPQVKQCIIDMLCTDEVGDHLFWDILRWLCLSVCLLLPCRKVLGRQRRVVLAERLELLRVPAPVLEHLARSLDKVTNRTGSVEPRVDGLRNKIVDTVT